MYYQTKQIISTPVGNNALSYEQRKAMWSSCQLSIPGLKIWTLDDIKIWNEIVFEEIDHKGNLQSCIGLESLLEIDPGSSPGWHGSNTGWHGSNTGWHGSNTAWQGKIKPSIFIIDNHNHALYLRYREYFAQRLGAWATLIHIDQHADMGIPSTPIDTAKCSDINYISWYTNEVCNVWNFIQPAIDSWLIKNIVQIRSVTKLLETIPYSLFPSPYILDIDIDFRVDHSPTKEEITAVHTHLQWASVCTIALSPYFMPLEKSIAVVKMLFS